MRPGVGAGFQLERLDALAETRSLNEFDWKRQSRTARGPDHLNGLKLLPYPRSLGCELACRAEANQHNPQ